MERKRKRSLSCGAEEEDADRRISPRKRISPRRTKVRYTENSYDNVEEDDDDKEDEEEERGTDVEEDDEQPGPSTSYYSNTQKNTNNRLWTVTCGTKTGILDKAKLKKGTKCIKCDGRWFAPPAFENLGGKRYCRKWKATIFHENKPLQHWFEEGYLTTTRFKRRSAQTPRKKTGSCISESFSEEDEETEDKDYRDENELSGGEEPELEKDERSSEAANDTSVEDSLQNTSRDKEDQMESESVSAAANQELKAKLARTCDRRKVRVVLERLSEKNTDFPFRYSCRPNGDSLSEQLDENQEKKEDNTSTLDDPSFTDIAHVDSSEMSGPSLSGGPKEECMEEFTPSSERKEKVEDESGNDLSPLTTAEELTENSDREDAQTEKEVVKEEDDDDKTGNNSSPLSTEEEFTPISESKEAQIEEEVVVVLIEEDDDKIGNSLLPTTAEGFTQSSDRKEAQTEREEDETGVNSSLVSTAERFTQSSDRKEAVKEEGEDGTENNSSPVSTAASSGPDVAPDSEVIQSIDSNAANLSSPPGLFVTATDTSLVGDMKGRGEQMGEDGPETQSRCHKGFEECRNASEGNIVVMTAEAASQIFKTGYKTSWAAFTRKGRVADDPDMDSYNSGEDTSSSHDAAQPQPLKQDERAFQASQTPGTTHTRDAVPPSCCDLDTMDLSQLRMEKMRMQIKVLKLQEKYYTGKIKALQKSS